jgi:voltage-gated potassium channel
MNEEEKEIRAIEKLPRKIIIFFVLILTLFIIGILGYKIIAGKSVFESFIMVLETLAFSFHNLKGIGRALEIFLTTIGVILIWWICWSIFDIILDGNISEYLKIQKRLSNLKKMKNHYIIAGGGRVGEEIVKEFSLRKKAYVVIEKDESKVLALKKRGFFAIFGDVTDENVLNEANIKQAKAIILAMPETEKNLLVTMTAKELNPNIEVHARADKPSFVSKLKKAGATTVVVPEVVAAERFLENIK